MEGEKAIMVHGAGVSVYNNGSWRVVVEREILM